MRRPDGQEFAVLRNGAPAALPVQQPDHSPWQGICAESLAAIGRIHALRGRALAFSTVLPTTYLRYPLSI